MFSSNRNKHTIGSVLLSSLAVLYFLSSLLWGQQSPTIKFKENTWNFGQTQQGKILTHVFKFDNTGSETLIISNVRTSCGCAAALISSREVKPGQAGEIKVTFNTKGYEGEQTKYIYVDSNDAKTPKVQLAVKAAIDVPPRPKIELDSYAIDLGLILDTEGIETQTTLSNPGERELTVEFSHKSAQFKLEGKQINGPLKIAAGQAAAVSMNIVPRRNNGLVREYVLLRTNDPMRPNLSLYISGYIVTIDQLQELFARYKDKLKNRISR